VDDGRKEEEEEEEEEDVKSPVCVQCKMLLFGDSHKIADRFLRSYVQNTRLAVLTSSLDNFCLDSDLKQRYKIKNYIPLVCVLSCVFSNASYAYSKYTGIDKATLDTRGGGGDFS
jgi:hypothetical protein